MHDVKRDYTISFSRRSVYELGFEGETWENRQKHRKTGKTWKNKGKQRKTKEKRGKHGGKTEQRKTK